MTSFQKKLSQQVARRLGSNASFASVARLKKVQSVLKETNTDGLICIQGIDSRYNEGMQECTNYLLFGLLESDRKELVSVGYDDDIIDDFIVCIKPDTVEVYCNPLNYDFILRYIAGWPDVKIHCLSYQEYQADDDMTEEFKINCFVSMVSKCKHVAIPFYSMHQGAFAAPFDKMKIEQWPIIQAYALEGYGSGTFFTLKHDVTDISSALFKIYEKFDVMSAEKFITEQLPIFERQWEGLNGTVDVARMGNFSKGFTESNVAESLVTYYAHGRVGTQESQDSTNTSQWKKPFVYMGENTKYLSNDFATATNGELKTAGARQSPALHMVCHGVAPRSGLMCTRTYFFDSSALPPIVGGDNEYRNTDLEQLSKAYRVAIEVTLRSIAEYSSSLSPNEVISNAKKNVIKGLQKSMDCRKLDVQARIEARTYEGRHKAVSEGTTPQTTVTLSIVISNIHSVTHVGTILGGVAYSDTFLLSAIKYNSSGDILMNSETLNLTQNVVRWSSWNISPEVTAMTEKTQTLIHNKETKSDFTNICGEVLIDGQAVEIVSPQPWLQPVAAMMYLYEQAVILLSSATGPISLTKSDIKSASFYDGGGPSVPAFLILYTTLDFQTKLPTQLHNTMRMLVISLNPRTKAYKLFFEQVFNSWKSQEEGNFELKMEESLPESLAIVHEQATAKFKSQTSGGLSSRPMSSRVTGLQNTQLQNLQRFMSHIAMSACLDKDQPITSSDLSVLLDGSPSISETEEDKSEIMLTISIISGIPGSYKENVANFITQLTQERSRWVIHKQTAETSHQFDSGKLENTLSYIYSVLKKKGSSTNKASRMLVITPGFTDVQTVVRTIQSHPNKELRQHVRIGAVTTCVDPHNAFLTGYMTIPGIVNQCTPGWVNNVVMTSSTDAGNGNLTHVQDLIRAVNPTVNFIMTDRGELTRSQDIDLILADAAFQHPDQIRARLLVSRPAKVSGEAYGLNTVLLKFKQPLIKQKLMSKLRELGKISLGEGDSCVLHACGRSMFTGSEEVFDITYASVSNIVKPTAVQSKPGEAPASFFMSFSGYSLHEEKLKDALRTCVISKPDKKATLSVKALDRTTKNMIHKEKHLEPLPPGWFYNGTQYVDMSGERSDRHPEFEKFLQQYVDKENVTIQEHNNKIDQVKYKDLFE